jgi:hypothetical protein
MKKFIAASLLAATASADFEQVPATLATNEWYKSEYTLFDESWGWSTFIYHLNVEWDTPYRSGPGPYY